MVRGSRAMISLGFKVIFCIEEQFPGVVTWSHYSMDRCKIWIMDEMDMTPLQVRYPWGVSNTDSKWYSFNYYLCRVEQLPRGTWMSCYYGSKTMDEVDTIIRVKYCSPHHKSFKITLIWTVCGEIDLFYIIYVCLFQGWGQVLFKVLESSTSTFSYLQVQVQVQVLWVLGRHQVHQVLFQSSTSQVQVLW